MRPIIIYPSQEPPPVASDREIIEQTSCAQLETHSTPFLKLSDELVQHIFKKAVNKKEFSSGDTISRVSRSWNSAMKEIAKIDSEYLPIFSDRLYLKQLGTTPKEFGCRLEEVIKQWQSGDLITWDPKDILWDVETIQFSSAFSTCCICEEESSFELMIPLTKHNIENKRSGKVITVYDLHIHMLKTHGTLCCFGQENRPKGGLEKLVEVIGLPPCS